LHDIVLFRIAPIHALVHSPAFNSLDANKTFMCDIYIFLRSLPLDVCISSFQWPVLSFEKVTKSVNCMGESLNSPYFCALRLQNEGFYLRALPRDM
jgi:hypothetical protein